MSRPGQVVHPGDFGGVAVLTWALAISARSVRRSPESSLMTLPS